MRMKWAIGILFTVLGVAAQADTAPSFFDYSLATKGPLRIGYGALIIGVNDPSEATILCAGEVNPVLTIMEGSYIAGDVYLSNPSAQVALSDNVFIGGESLPGAVAEHVHIGSGPIEFFEIDSTVFAPFATTVVDSTTDVSSGTFTNIRIAAGTNPTFGDVTIQGVVYIEAPNRVSFSNNLDITGVIVTEDPGDGASLADHRITFKNNLIIHGVQLLPDTPQFAQLRTMPGTAILAPGFAVEFKNNFESVSGIIAAESMTLDNNLEAILYGSIIVYGDQGLDLKHNAHLTVDRSRYQGTPTGFVPEPITLSLLALGGLMLFRRRKESRGERACHSN